MQKAVDLYRGEQGTCRDLLARAAMLTHSSTGIWLLKGQNERLLVGHVWIACLSLPCLSIERKSSNPSTGAKQPCRVYPSRVLQACRSRGCSQSRDSRSRRGHKRLLESRAEPAQPRWASARNAEQVQNTALFPSCHSNPSVTLQPGVSVCLQLLSDAFTASSGLCHLLWAPEQPKQGTNKKTQTINNCFMTPSDQWVQEVR